MKHCSSGSKSLPTWTLGASLGLVILAAACGDEATTTPGASMLYCWDLNANGACDPAVEDVDGDGACTIADCRGESGEPGLDGINGIDGIAGNDCWDTNQNDECDVDTEDFNADQQCDASDCVGLTNGALDGTITNAASDNPLQDVTITIVPAAGGPLTSGADGTYSVSLPTGFYTVEFSRDDFATIERTVPIAAAQVTTIDVALEPDAPVVVNAGPDATVDPDGTVSLTPDITITDDSTIVSTTWEQVAGVPIVGDDPDPDNNGVADMTFQDLAAYKADLVGQIELLDRWQVVPINTENLDHTRTAVFEVTVVTTSGTYTDSVTLTVNVPWKVAPGLRNVPLNVPVLLQGLGDPDTLTWTWTVTDKDANPVVVTDADTKYPYFTPTVSGAYTAIGTSSDGGTPPVEVVRTINMTGATWLGAIEGQDANGLPTTTSCGQGPGNCHHADGAGNEIYAQWREGGHANTFSDYLNTKSYFKASCFPCHATAYQPGAANAGLDDASDYNAFMSSGLLGSPDADNWTTMLTDYPSAAKLASVQCDACHGPSAGGAHATQPDQRNSMASEVCATCHGDLPGWGLYQQWQTASHGSYTEALARATVENGGTNTARCGRCHSAQGFLHWYRATNLTANLQGATGQATNAEMSAWGMNVAQVEPITCAVCHDPHDVGHESGNPNRANVRVSGSVGMLNGGFAAPGMGRGAICVMCHTSIGGRHDDSAAGELTSYSMPHKSSQGDALLGQGAYFVTPGLYRSPHAYIEDTCTACHMAKAAPPASLSKNGEGSNHTFLPSLESCEQCHGDYSGEGMVTAGESLLAELHEYLSERAIATLTNTASITITSIDPVSQKTSATGGITIDTTTNHVVGIDFIEFRGQGGLALTLEQNITWTNQGVTFDSNVTWVQFSALKATSTGALVYPLPSNYVKGVYNYLLLHADQSEGIHNPTFYSAVVASTMAQDLSF